jgi:hypothetical protein
MPTFERESEKGENGKELEVELVWNLMSVDRDSGE